MRSQLDAVIRWVAVMCVLGSVACGQSPKQTRFNPTARLQTVRAASREGQDFRLFVEQGTASQAADYALYIENALGFPVDGTLDQLLAFCGYGGVGGHELEITPSPALMARFPGRVLASRFFAPKVIDVSSVGGAAPTKDLGWRKVVRLSVDPGSPAGARGIASMVLLFNVFQPRAELAQDPFEPCTRDAARCSANNQVILVPRTIEPGKDAIYWMVFERAATGGARTDHLDASFDGGDQASTSSGSSVKSYYLPDACAQCHGGSAAEGKLNYLDSDHWFDRTRPGDDFADLGSGSSNGVVFDGGRDTQSAQFKDAFAVLTRLNDEIAGQNRAAGGDDFGLRAVEQWLKVHANSTDFADPIARALPAPSSDPSARVWADTPDDRTLLRDLNRYCYRCHSSVAYHVFDKQAVFIRKNSMARRVELGPLRPGGMPQDRTIDADTVRDLAARLRALQ